MNTRAERLARLREVDLYPVTCERLSNGRSDFEILDGIIAGGAAMVQLRDKDADKRTVYKKAEHFRRVTAAHDILLIVNDHVDIALAVDADGAHLGQDDLPAGVARGLGPDLIVGVSSHTKAEAEQAECDGADYVNIGPIFPTQTKDGVGRGLGVEAIAANSAGLGIPFTVMGGITRDNLAAVRAAGARTVAVVTAVTRAPDVAAAVRELRACLRA